MSNRRIPYPFGRLGGHDGKLEKDGKDAALTKAFDLQGRRSDLLEEASDIPPSGEWQVLSPDAFPGGLDPDDSSARFVSAAYEGDGVWEFTLNGDNPADGNFLDGEGTRWLTPALPGADDFKDKMIGFHIERLSVSNPSLLHFVLLGCVSDDDGSGVVAVFNSTSSTQIRAAASFSGGGTSQSSVFNLNAVGGYLYSGVSGLAGNPSIGSLMATLLNADGIPLPPNTNSPTAGAQTLQLAAEEDASDLRFVLGVAVGASSGGEFTARYRIRYFIQDLPWDLPAPSNII